MSYSAPETRASLILRLRDADDVAAWEEFTDLYGSVVFRLARRQGLQTADADDLVQEVMSSVAQSVANWLLREDRGSFRAWLFRIARNTAIDFLTRRKHRPWATGGTDAIERFGRLPADSESLSSEFELEYRREVFSWASQRVREVVTETTWKAFWRTSVDGQSVQRVADELGMSVGAVYIARTRAMKQLQKMVQQREIGDEV